MAISLIHVAIESLADNPAVRVTDIAPGMVGGTEFSSVCLKGDQARMDTIYKRANALTPDDIAETVFWTGTLLARMNINFLDVMPVTQSFGPLAIHRQAVKRCLADRSKCVQWTGWTSIQIMGLRTFDGSVSSLSGDP